MLFLNSQLGLARQPQEASNDVRNALKRCQQTAEDNKRLFCFDSLAKRFAKPAFEGKLGYITEPFRIDKSTRLRYRSHGIIFVLYLRDEAGKVLQNLHIGGNGEDSYLIEKPGIYSLKVDGSAGWEIWLEALGG